MPKNYRDIRVYAFRYCLGRMTYSVHTMVETILDEWDDIPEGDKRLFKKEIQTAIDDGCAGMNMDVQEWAKILNKELQMMEFRSVWDFVGILVIVGVLADGIRDSK